jgi:hypothetical protein
LPPRRLEFRRPPLPDKDELETLGMQAALRSEICHHHCETAIQKASQKQWGEILRLANHIEQDEDVPLVQVRQRIPLIVAQHHPLLHPVREGQCLSSAFS